MAASEELRQDDKPDPAAVSNLAQAEEEEEEEWAEVQVPDFLRGMGLAQYVPAFEERGYDTMEIVALMDAEAIRSCIRKPGHALLFQRRLEAFRREAAAYHYGYDYDVAGELAEAAPSKLRPFDEAAEAAAAAAEAEYFDLARLPWYWMLFIFGAFVIGTGLHCHAFRHVTGMDLPGSTSMIAETIETLTTLDQVMESLQTSIAESEAMAAAAAEDSPIMEALREWSKGAELKNSMHPMAMDVTKLNPTCLSASSASSCL